MEENKRRKQQHKNVGIITKAVRKEKRRREKRLGRRLTREETKSMIKEMAAKLGVRVAMVTAAVGITVGTFMHRNDTKQLPEPQAIEMADEDGNTISKEEEFRNSLQLTPEQEMDSLETSEEVLNYIKEMYAEEYNKNNDEQITSDDIKFYKKTENIAIYIDEAENGDEILRRTTVNKISEHLHPYSIDNPIILAEINTADGLKKEQVTEYNGEYVPVYYSSTHVKEYSENSLCDIGEILNTGLDKVIELRRQESKTEAKSEKTTTQENDNELEI